MNEYQYIGKRLPFKDSVKKVQGKSIYGADVTVPGMLQGRVLRSPYPRARVTAIDVSRALDLPGVIAIATPWNTPSNNFGIIKQDELFLTDDARYVGDEIVAVAAVNGEVALEAIELINVEYEILTPIFDPVEALKSGAPIVHSRFGTNLCHHLEVERGDINSGFEKATVILEETFILPYQYQAYMEPQVATAMWEGKNLTVWAPGQSAKHLSDWFSSAFGLSSDNFRFIQTSVGGGFGGKNYMRVVPIAAILAKMTNAPVQMILSREEDFVTAETRVPMTIHLKMGANEEGLITAKETRIIADNGAYAFLAPGVLEVASVRVDTLYRIENIKTVADLVYTNKMGTGGMRGFGNPQSHFAVETMMDMIADALGLDPAVLRLRNAVHTGDISIHGYRLGSCGLDKTIELALEKSQWKKNRSKQKEHGSKKYGIGMASAVHVSGSVMASPDGDGSSIQVQIYEDGSVHILSGEGDIGQGAGTIIAQIVSEELGIPYDQVYVQDLDTNFIHGGAGAQGSRVTLYAGNAAIMASKEATMMLKKSAANLWDCDTQYIILRDGRLINLKSEEEIEINVAARHFVSMTGGSRILGQGLFRALGGETSDNNRYGNISLAYPFATQIAEVMVDTDTGKIDVINIIAVHDSGRIINPLGVEGQVEGGVLQGIGYALYEDFIINDGKLMNPNFTDYNILTIKDAPDIQVHFVETDDPYGPYGAKSVSEIALVPTAAAIANAVYNATGIRLTKLPLTISL